MTTWETLAEDFRYSWRHSDMPSRGLGQVAFIAAHGCTVRGIATLGFRTSHAAGARVGALGSALKQITQIITGADVDHRAVIGPGLRLLHPGSVVVASDAVLGSHCTIHSCVTIGSTPEGGPTIGDYCDLAPGCRIIGPIHLGDRVRVYPNAVVTCDFPSGVVVAGAPAKVVREVSEDDFLG